MTTHRNNHCLDHLCGCDCREREFDNLKARIMLKSILATEIQRFAQDAAALDFQGLRDDARLPGFLAERLLGTLESEGLLPAA